MNLEELKALRVALWDFAKYSNGGSETFDTIKKVNQAIVDKAELEVKKALAEVN